MGHASLVLCVYDMFTFTGTFELSGCSACIRWMAYALTEYGAVGSAWMPVSRLWAVCGGCRAQQGLGARANSTADGGRFA